MLTIMKTLVNNWKSLLAQVEQDVLNEHDLSFEQAIKLTDIPDDLIEDLAKIATKVRERHSQDKVDLCSIINARSGKCSEDCKFCTQSAHHKTDPPVYPMKTVDDIVEAAKNAEENGAHRFCIVTSGPKLNDDDFKTALEATKRIKHETTLKCCASLGQLSKRRAKQLKEAGLSRYHHNVETASSFFPEICSTHTYEEKSHTIDQLNKAEIETCVGGILNMGETPEQRIEFAFELKKINPSSIPINFLNPRHGTPLDERPLISAIEAAKYLAIFRLILPKTYIRLAGGRIETFGDNPELPFTAGVNALLIGDLLTTEGPKTHADLELLESLGFDTNQSS